MLGFKKSAKGYSGSYAPAQPGQWAIELHLPAGEAERLRTVDVNGVRQALLKSPEGTMRFAGESEPRKPVRWGISGQGG